MLIKEEAQLLEMPEVGKFINDFISPTKHALVNLDLPYELRSEEEELNRALRNFRMKARKLGLVEDY